MSQGEVLKYLEKNGKATSEEMARKLNISRIAVVKNLRALEKQGLITFIEGSRIGTGRRKVIWMVKK